MDKNSVREFTNDCWIVMEILKKHDQKPEGFLAEVLADCENKITALDILLEKDPENSGEAILEIVDYLFAIQSISHCLTAVKKCHKKMIDEFAQKGLIITMDGISFKKPKQKEG